MAARKFTSAEWKKIQRELDRDAAGFGLPERVYGSLVFGSFNIRKLGSARKRSPATWEFLARLCRRFDLLAVQEVMDDLSGLERLVALMGPEYEMIVSDKTGAFPGARGLNERLAFVYRPALVQRAHIVSDITYDRSKVLEILDDKFDDIATAIGTFRERRRRHEAGELRRPPKLEMPVFLSFIRQPYCVSFRVVGHPDSAGYEFMAVNAHLIFGAAQDRKQEFDALMDWIVGREKHATEGNFPGLVLLGDLNLDFNNPERDIRGIRQYLEPIVSKEGDEITPVFPFLEKHPRHRRVLRTNARQKETFDHIALFFRSRKIPESVRKRKIGEHPTGPDYGVVNFVDLFSRALKRKPAAELTAAQLKAFYPRFEHEVSDHMPIWFRAPLPE